jgi:1,4-dihydroxy-2-naphthoate octaprenyltransferase
MSTRMWREAVVGVPRVDHAEWERLDPVSRWLIASRAAVLVMTLISAAIAGILAWQADMFDFWSFLLVVVGLLAAHAANNLLNDLTDHWTGADRDNSFRTQYGSQPLESGLMTVRQSIAYAVATGLVGIAVGVWFIVQRGALAALLLGLGAFFVVAYTWPLKHIGLGEPAVLVVWGPLMVGGGYYAITGSWSWEVVLASLPYALGVTAVLFGKHIDKIPNDKERGIHTLPVIMGETASRWTVLAMIAAQYVLAMYLVATGSLPWPVLAVLGAAPLLRFVWPVFTNPKPEAPPPEYPKGAWPLWYVSIAFVHNRRFGLLYLIGLVAGAILF